MLLLGKKDQTKSWSQYYQLLSQISSILNDIEIAVLSKDVASLYSFFDMVQKFAESKKDEKVEVKDKDERYYAEELLAPFYRTFFDWADQSPRRFDIWDFFPETWKIKGDTLSDNVFQKIALVTFLQWAADRMSGIDQEEFDKPLNSVSKYLFPEVDPIAWAPILILALSSYDPSARMKSVIERQWPFGLSGRIRAYSGYSSDDPDAETKMNAERKAIDDVERAKTLGMVKALSKLIPTFYHSFKKENITKLRDEANALNYTNNPKFQRRKELYIEIFNQLLAVAE
jgi:hypothetical protein